VFDQHYFCRNPPGQGQATDIALAATALQGFCCYGFEAKYQKLNFVVACLCRVLKSCGLYSATLPLSFCATTWCRKISPCSALLVTSPQRAQTYNAPFSIPFGKILPTIRSCLSPHARAFIP